MTSPFKTYQEFSEANGAIYTFANNPVMIGILLLLCAAILIYFIYMSFAIKQSSAASSPTSLPALLLASALTLAGLAETTASRQSPEATKSHPQTERWSRQPLRPLALLGIVGIGATTLKRKRNRRSRFVSRSRMR